MEINTETAQSEEKIKEEMMLTISVKSIACGRAYRGKDPDPDYKRPAGKLFRVNE